MCSRGEPSAAERRALGLDEALGRVARSLGAFDLALGMTLARLFDLDLLGQLGYSREADYARERLGLPPSTMFSLVRLARELRSRPVLRQAVVAGLVSTRKALAVLPLAVGDHEGDWTEAATRLSLAEIEGAVRAAGKESPEERFETEAIVLPMTEGQQARLDAALSLAKETIGPEARHWQLMEAICEEWLSGFGEWEGVRGPETPPPEPRGRAAKIVARQLAGVEEALDAIRGIEGEHPSDDALGLDARARRLLSARLRYDESFGILADRVQRGRVFAALGYRSFEEYCNERLLVRAATVRQRTWLERRMRLFPALREALSSGRLTYSKALAVARHATPLDIGERIARAASTTCQQAERESDEEEGRKNRGAGTRKVWAPRDAVPAIRDAIASAQAWSEGTRGVEIDAGEALAVVADHFVEVWEPHFAEGARWLERQRRHVLMRKGGLCAVPGCSRAARHVHHIVFRSRGGARTPENEIGLCAPHHLRGIHMGYLEVTGRAGERLHWKFGTGEATPTEEWVTFGDDDVRRADRAGARAPAAPGADYVAESSAGRGHLFTRDGLRKEMEAAA